MAKAKTEKTKAAAVQTAAGAVDVFADGGQPAGAEAPKPAEQTPPAADAGQADTAPPAESGVNAGEQDDPAADETNDGQRPDPAAEEGGAVPPPAGPAELVTDAANAPVPTPAPPATAAKPAEKKTRTAKPKRYRCREACRFMNRSWEVGEFLPPMTAKTAIPSFFEAVDV